VNLTLVGLSHQSTPIAVRERAFVPLPEAAELARELTGEGEAVCLSTCNRTELYLVGDAAESRAFAALAQMSGLSEDELRAVVYRLHDEAAALHLFRVAAGLDSMVPGEGEILGQVRAAYEAGVTGPVLDRLFRQALYAGKKVRTAGPSDPVEILGLSGVPSAGDVLVAVSDERKARHLASIVSLPSRSSASA